MGCTPSKIPTANALVRNSKESQARNANSAEFEQAMENAFAELEAQPTNSCRRRRRRKRRKRRSHQPKKVVAGALKRSATVTGRRTMPANRPKSLLKRSATVHVRQTIDIGYSRRATQKKPQRPRYGSIDTYLYRESIDSDATTASLKSVQIDMPRGTERAFARKGLDHWGACSDFGLRTTVDMGRGLSVLVTESANPAQSLSKRRRRRRKKRHSMKTIKSVAEVATSVRPSCLANQDEVKYMMGEFDRDTKSDSSMAAGGDDASEVSARHYSWGKVEYFTEEQVAELPY